MGRDHSERRQSARAPYRSLVHYGIRRGDGLWSLRGLGSTEDVSLSGLRLTCKEPLPVGATVELALHLGTSVRDAQARVRWAHEVERDRLYAAGLEFDSVQLGFLKDLCDRLLLAVVPGKVSEGDMSAFIQRVAESRDAGLLAIEAEKSRGYIAVREGHVLAARASGDLQGLEALAEIFATQRGRATFIANPLPALVTEQKVAIDESFVRSLRNVDEAPEEDEEDVRLVA